MSEETENEKNEYLPQMWQTLSRLSEEALNAARQSVDEKKFDKNRGVVGLDETLINLVDSRNFLQDAIEKKKLQQLPISLQKNLISRLNEIQNSVMLLASGTDEIANLADRVEALNADIWRFGLHNLSSEVLGYQTKLNQLKHQETEILRVQEGLKKALELRNSAEKASQEMSSISAKIKEEQSSVAEAAATVTENSSAIRQFHDKASADFAGVQKASEDVARLLASVTSAHGQVITRHDEVNKAAEAIEIARDGITSFLSESTKAFDIDTSQYAELHARVESDAKELSGTLTQKIAALIEGSDTTIKNEVEAAKTSVSEAIELAQREAASIAETHDTQLKRALKDFEAEKKEQLATAGVSLQNFLDKGQADHQELKIKLEDLENQIKDKIYQATGYTLFSAFQKRQNDVAKAKLGWAIATIVGVIAALGVAFYVVHAIHSVQDVRFEFFAKLSLSIPVIYAIGFCSIQYSRERRLEEEYAFKSSVSVSLNPYQELVSNLVAKTDEAELAKYTAFVIHSVENVFSSPTDKVFDTHVKEGRGLTEGKIKQFTKLLEPIAQIVAKK